MLNNTLKQDNIEKKEILKEINKDIEKDNNVENKSGNMEIPESIINLLNKIFEEENVSLIAQKVLLKLIDKIIKTTNKLKNSDSNGDKEDNILKNETKYNNLQITLKNIWQDDFDKNMTYVKRAMSWLKLENLVDEHVNNLVEFFSKLLNLGQILSEDSLHSTNHNSSSLNKDEALIKRRALTENKDNLSILSNKGHYMHNALLSELNALNSIIAKK